MSETDCWKTHPYLVRDLDEFSMNRFRNQNSKISVWISLPEIGLAHERNWLGTHEIRMDEFSRNRFEPRDLPYNRPTHVYAHIKIVKV